MVKLGKDYYGVSPVIAVILMVAVVIILAGVVSIWVFTYSDYTEDNEGTRLLEVNLDGETDEISITIKSGRPMETRFMKVNIEGQQAIVPQTTISVGQDLVVNSPIDLISRETYNIKISYKDAVIYNIDVEVPYHP